MKRRELLPLLLALPTLAWAEPPKTPTESENLYYEATRLLMKGRRFERAAEMLAQAEAKVPLNYRYPAARGCALASRVASLAYAASFAESLAEERANFPKSLAEWEAAQKDPDSDGYGDLKPEMPPIFTFPIKDDGQPFRMTKEQVRHRVAELLKASRAAFEMAEKRARTPEEKADAAYQHGSGLSLLWKYGFLLSDKAAANGTGIDLADRDTDEAPSDSYEDFDNAKVGETPLPKSKEILAAFTRAKENQPTNPLYWCALAEQFTKPEEKADAYLKAAELSPRDARLWYLLFNLEAQKGFDESTEAGGKRADQNKALFYLRRGQKADPSNAWLYYEEAGLHFRRSKYSLFTTPPGVPQSPEQQAEREATRDKWYHTLQYKVARDAGATAVNAAIAGNATPNCYFPQYEPAVPKLLMVAWNYNFQLHGVSPFTQYARLRELARALGGYALFLAQENNETEAVRACRTAIGIGQRLEGDWPTVDSPSDTRVLQTLVGHAVVSIGLKLLVSVEKIAGTPAKALAVQTEFDTFQARVTEYKTILNKRLEQIISHPTAVY